MHVVFACPLPPAGVKRATVDLAKKEDAQNRRKDIEYTNTRVSDIGKAIHGANKNIEEVDHRMNILGQKVAELEQKAASATPPRRSAAPRTSTP